MLVDVLDQSVHGQNLCFIISSDMSLNIPFMHEKNMRPARNVWMASDREDADLARIRVVRKLPVEIIEVIPPNVFNISRIYPSMAVGTVLDEHHRR
jgi:hypothetical protein